MLIILNLLKWNILMNYFLIILKLVFGTEGIFFIDQVISKLLKVYREIPNDQISTYEEYEPCFLDDFILFFSFDLSKAIYMI